MPLPRLRNRQLQIPNGMSFYLPALKWTAPRGASLSQIAQALQRVVLAHPALAQKHQWPTDLKAIEDWVDLYNAALCARMGWTDYISADAEVTVPKPSAPHQQQLLQSLKSAAAAAKQLVSGAKTLTEYLESGEPVVGPELALARATTCSQCPKNEPGDLTKWFTVPAAEYIRRQIEKAQKRNLATLRDDDLHLCTACHCPLRLKVHIPLDWVVKRLNPEEVKRLREGRNCWILSESGQ